MTSKIKEEYIRRLLKDGKRADGREFLAAREISVRKDVAHNAEGSAQVTMGDSVVLVGVKLGTGEPFPDTPDEGVLMVNAELVPVASPDFMPGPPDENSIELARVVDRGIRESKVIDNKKLCITPKEKVWMVSTDIHVLNDGGNLIDAGALAAVIALKNCKIPKLDEDGDPDYSKKEGKLPLKGIPLTTTVAKIDGKLLLDPSIEEEHVADCKLTVTVIDGKLSAMQKGGAGGFSPEEIEEIIQIAIENSGKLKRIVEGS